jgi:hypothetical protein
MGVIKVAQGGGLTSTQANSHRADISGANLAQTLALFLQKSFQKIWVAKYWRLTELNRKRRGKLGETHPTT